MTLEERPATTREAKKTRDTTTRVAAVKGDGAILTTIRAVWSSTSTYLKQLVPQSMALCSTVPVAVLQREIELFLPDCLGRDFHYWIRQTTPTPTRNGYHPSRKLPCSFTCSPESTDSTARVTRSSKAMGWLFFPLQYDCGHRAT